MLAKDKAAAMKGVAITLGPSKKSYVVYDLDTLRLAAAWTGEFLEFGNTLTKIEWPPPPSIKGTLAFTTANEPGWSGPKEALSDPRANPQGPLPKDWAHYSGLYVNGDQVVLSYTVGGVPVLETPNVTEGATPVFTRTLEFGSPARSVSLLLASGIAPAVPAIKLPEGRGLFTQKDGTPLSVGWEGGSKTSGSLKLLPNGDLVLHLDRVAANQPLTVALSASGTLSGFANGGSPKTLTRGGALRWTETLVTEGRLGSESGPYAVDTIMEPFPNPFQVSMFFGGFDFLSGGRAAICTFHGDVWIVSGIDATLKKLTWKRYASGLFQPLGLKVVKGEIYVAGRDQITRLKDLNGDGEADFYENFNNDTFVTANYHEFCLGLDTDKAGNFYFAKGAPWPPTVQSAHQGTMLKVAKDGSKLNVVATGLRAPNGMAIGPNGWITVSDNQGHYMPSSKLNLIREGGFYGMRQAAHGKAPPDDNIHAYDQPMCWLPMNMDNSSGGQVWVDSTKWGPLNGQLLFMSYGKGTLFSVMPQEVDGVVQAGMVQFPLKFTSGTMRGRFSPADGQLYVSGLRGWQTAGVRDGGFSRVRYTGEPVRMPQALHVSKDGVRITFTTALDEASAKDVGNWNVEMWNYIYSAGYGSPEVSTKDSKVKKHDKLEVTAVSLSADKKTVTLKLSELTPAMQMKVKFNLKAADGSPISSEIYNTIHKVAAK